MNDYHTRITQITHLFDEKKIKKLQIDSFVRLCDKMGEENTEVNELLRETYSLLVEISNSEELKYKNFVKSLNNLKKIVRKNLGYTQKGAIQEEYTAIGIAIGVAIGAGFSSMNTALMGIGIPVGLAIGISIGKKKESEAEEAGKTY